MKSDVKPSFEPEVWVDRHGDVLYRFALLRLRDGALAEEVVQETFLAALQSHGKFTGQSSERTWLVSILKHKIVDYYRRASRERPADELADMPDGDLELFDSNRYWIHEIGPKEWGASPATEYERRQFWGVLEGCLGELPPRIATAFSMRELDDFSSDEICKVLGITTTNLWVMLHRARAHLRLCLENRWVGERTTAVAG
jgi:RNA polymerase sigma-70 factor, ECF subfamily